MAEIILSDIYIYPVKSLSGIRLPSWEVVDTGFKYDRQWMLIDGDGQFLSQRRLPVMALLKTRLEANRLIISAPNTSDLQVPLEYKDGEKLNATVWHDVVETLAVSSEADAWFSSFLKLKCRLVYQPASSIRQVNQQYASPADRTALSDGFPFLLISANSLAALNQVMQLEMAMNRFRPNLVVSGCDGYAEDSWRQISIGGIGFRLPKPCSRCSVPTIEPETAETGKEPLTTLSRLRKWQNKVYFGQNALHDGSGLLSVGDTVQIHETGPRQPPIY